MGEFLRDFCEWKKKASPTFSVRSLAKKLEFKSHSLLAMIVRGERNPKPETLKALADFAQLSEREYEYLLNLLLFQKAKSAKEKLRLGILITKQRPDDDELVVEVDGIAIFERWYHIAILEMTLLEKFFPDPEWIAAQLGVTLNSEMVVDAIERLVRAGLLVKNADGSLNKSSLVTRNRRKISTSAVRSFHKQLLQRASVAIDAQNVGDRIFFNTMMPFNSADIQPAKDMIADFVEKFQTRFVSTSGDCLYNLGNQFFYVTKPEIKNP